MHRILNVASFSIALQFGAFSFVPVDACVHVALACPPLNASCGCCMPPAEKGLSDLAAHYLMKAGISAIRRLRKTDNNRIARACGATIVSRPGAQRRCNAAAPLGGPHCLGLPLGAPKLVAWWGGAQGQYACLLGGTCQGSALATAAGA